jgi:hypothetical protein
LRDRRPALVAVGPRRLIATALVVIAGVSASFAALRLAADPLLLHDIVENFAIPAGGSYPHLAAIGVALLVGVATLATLSRNTRR